MIRKRRGVFVFLLLFVLMAAAGCGRAAAPTATITAVPTSNSGGSPLATTVPTAAGGGLPVTSGGTSQPLAMSKGANGCKLIDSNDLAHLFPPHNEITRGETKTGQVSHPPFSNTAAPGTETSCLFFDFHLPGQKTGWLLQLTYLVDAPDPAMVQAWSAAWDAAKANAQPVSGLGDDAFSSGPNLFIKTKSIYLSFEGIDTHLDQKTADGIKQLLAEEEQLAQAALGRLK
jgi:hypothetical protein